MHVFARLLLDLREDLEQLLLCGRGNLNLQLVITVIRPLAQGTTDRLPESCGARGAHNAYILYPFDGENLNFPQKR